MKFVNLHTGNVYDGSKPYIHWFENPLSTDLIYVQPICFITNTNKLVVSCRSDVFSLVNPSVIDSAKPENINEFVYTNINDIKVSTYSDCAKSNCILTKSEVQGEQQYIRIIYIIASSSTAAEYVDKFTINGEEFFIGADFYQGNETLKINASNMGVNIPPQIQSSIYSSNVHEEKHDNILLNRKFKELVSNYWDLIANKGSYKSLMNTLEWFEYGDLIRLREIWKHDRSGKDVYDDREVCSVMSEKYKSSFYEFFKTTYFAIWCALQKETGVITQELNPELEAQVFKWSIEDMSLKMSMLGNFYETYFMPIHTELIQASIEDLVFTNTIKVNNRIVDSIDDLINLNSTFKCIVNNDKDVVIGDVSVGVDDNTVFGIRHGEHDEEYNITPIGVKSIEDINVINNDSELKTLLSQNYNGPGAIVPIECIFNIDEDERIVCGDILLTRTDFSGNVHESYVQDLRIAQKMNGNILKFNILLLHSTNEVSIHFVSSKGKHYSKVIDIPMKDISNVVLGMYKVKRNSELKIEDIGNPSNIYAISGIKKPSDYESFNCYDQYIVNDLNPKHNPTGIGLNHVVALEPGWKNVLSDSNRKLINKYYMKINKGTNDIKTVLISKFFIDSMPDEQHIVVPPVGGGDEVEPIMLSSIDRDINMDVMNIKEQLDVIWRSLLKKYVYFSRASYFSGFHHLEPFGSFSDKNSTFEDFTISQYDTLCVMPIMNIPTKDDQGNTIWVTYTYGRDIDENSVSWEFYNRSVNKKYVIKDFILEPNILSTIKEEFKDGYYDIIFKYRFEEDKTAEHEIKLNSAFVKKSI